MNCEQVEELLSAYLDNALAPEERRAVAVHLYQCQQCSSILADFRRFDALVSQLPRVSPLPALREKIFASPEYLELTGTFDVPTTGREVEDADDWTVPLPAARNVRRDNPGRPQLVAIPGGRGSHSTRSTSSANPTRGRLPLVRPSRGKRNLFVTLGTLAAAVLVTFALGSIFTLTLWSKPAPIAPIGRTTPPEKDQSQGPLSAGNRFVFLRDGALWSTLSDGSSNPERLTPDNVTVASDWVVSPPLPGRSAGDMVAYIDLQSAAVHIIRSDGLRDTRVNQPLLKPGVQPASIWDTATGMAILNSLTWSANGSMLAFVADPAGTGLTNLYVYSKDTGSVQMVSLPVKGSVSHPVWSPDGVRLAFELTHDGTIASIWDYNTQNQGLLTITDGINSQGSAGLSVLTLDWSANMNMPAITWSVGTIGNVQSIWIRRVGVAGTPGAALLTSGDYVQAIYSRSGPDNVGSWLLVPSIIGRPGDLWRIDALPGAHLIPLTYGKQVNFAWWSPDGTQIDYLDAVSLGTGTFHVVNITTGIDSLIATGVADTPAPAWSMDSQELVYTTGTQILIVDVGNLHPIQKPLILKLQGPASAYVWSTAASSVHQLIVAENDVQQGIYLVDAQLNTFVQVDRQGSSGPISWTEIP